MVDMHSKIRHFAVDTNVYKIEKYYHWANSPTPKLKIGPHCLSRTRSLARQQQQAFIGDIGTMNLFLKENTKGRKIPLFERKAWRPYGFLNNADFYEKLRYYMWTLEFPSWLAKAMKSDASHFLWKTIQILMLKRQ
eukprot:4773271-Pleurochrysis_carterae.AAC.1